MHSYHGFSRTRNTAGISFDSFRFVKTRQTSREPFFFSFYFLLLVSFFFLRLFNRESPSGYLFYRDSIAAPANDARVYLPSRRYSSVRSFFFSFFFFNTVFHHRHPPTSRSSSNSRDQLQIFTEYNKCPHSRVESSTSFSVLIVSDNKKSKPV